MKKRKQKIVVAIVSFVVIFLAIWCVKYLHSQSKSYTKVEKEAYDIGEYAINVLDSYLKGLGTREDTIKKLEDLRMSFIGKDGTDYILLSSDILRARFCLMDNDISGIKEVRQEIAKEIGYKD